MGISQSTVAHGLHDRRARCRGGWDRSAAACSRSDHPETTSGSSPDSHVEADVHDVPVLDRVGLSFETLEAPPRGLGVRAALDEVVPRITSQRMKPRAMSGGSSRPRRARSARVGGPGASLLVARGEEVRAESFEEPAHDLGEGRGAVAVRGRLLAGSSTSSASSFTSIPPGPFSTSISGFVVSGSSSGGSSPGHS